MLCTLDKSPGTLNETHPLIHHSWLCRSQERVTSVERWSRCLPPPSLPRTGPAQPQASWWDWVPVNEVLTSIPSPHLLQGTDPYFVVVFVLFNRNFHGANGWEDLNHTIYPAKYCKGSQQIFCSFQIPSHRAVPCNPSPLSVPTAHLPRCPEQLISNLRLAFSTQKHKKPFSSAKAPLCRRRYDSLTLLT